MLSKIFNVLFSGTVQTIEAIKTGQADLKKQIRSAVSIIEGIQASQTDQSDSFKVLQLQINKIKQEIKIPQVQRADFDTVLNSLNSVKIDIERLQTQIDAIKAQPEPQPEIVPAEIEAQPEPIKARAKARTMTQPRAKIIKQVNNAGILPWSEFQAVLKRALKVIPKTGIIRQLSNAVIVTTHNTVKVICTDLELSYDAILEHDSLSFESQNKSFLISRDLVETLSKITGRIEFSYDPIDQIVYFQSGNFSTSHNCGSVSEYPRLPYFAAENLAISDCPQFIPAIVKTLSGSATDAAKSVLNGACVVRDNADQITIAATDGYKLIVDTMQANNTEWGSVQEHRSNNKNGLHFILPRSASKHLSGFKTHSSVKVFVTHSHCKIELSTGEAVYTRLIEGIFPNFNQILPKSFQRKIKIDRKQWLAGVKELKGFVSKETKIFTVNVNHDQITLNSGYEKCVIKTDARLTDGEPMQISFNRDHFEILLNNFDCDYLIMGINSEIQPALFTDESSHVSQRQFMIMPIKP